MGTFPGGRGLFVGVSLPNRSVIRTLGFCWPRWRWLGGQW
uniref:Uncharacterized protein n=1 Tax=Zea mays TaxID=4577 RepID=B6TNW7_MAIZE|nr:hypothetical protein [Zea mays]